MSRRCIDTEVFNPLRPTTNASGITRTGVTQNTLSLNWTVGSGDSTLVLAQYNVTDILFNPMDGINYTANSIYGSGDAVGNSFCVYNGTGNSLILSGLTANRRYCLKLFSYNQSDLLYCVSEGTYTVRSYLTIV